MAKKRANRKNRKPTLVFPPGMDPYKDKDYVASGTRSEIEGRRIMRNPYTQPNVSNPAVLRAYGEGNVAGPNPYTVFSYPTGLEPRNRFGESSRSAPFTRKDVLADIRKKSQTNAQRRTNLKKKK
jgi:hypothetical protein